MKKLISLLVIVVLLFTSVFGAHIFSSAEESAELINIAQGKEVFTVDYVPFYGEASKANPQNTNTAYKLTDGDYDSYWVNTYNDSWMKDENDMETNSNPFAVIKLSETPIKAQQFAIVLTNNDNNWGPDSFKLFGTNDESVFDADWREKFTDANKYKLVFDSKNHSEIGFWTDGSQRNHIVKGVHQCDFDEEFNYKYLILQIIAPRTATMKTAELSVFSDVEAYTVTYQDYNGNILKSEKVATGCNSIPPIVTRDGFNFIGWDKSYENITEDVVLTAQYVVKGGNAENILSGKTVVAMPYKYCGYGVQESAMRDKSKTNRNTAQYLIDDDLTTMWHNPFNNTWHKTKEADTPTGQPDIAMFSKGFVYIKLGEEPVSAETFSITFSSAEWGAESFKIYGTNDDAAVRDLDWRNQFTNVNKETFILCYDSSKDSSIPTWTCGNGDKHINCDTYQRDFTKQFNYKYVILQVISPNHNDTYCADFKMTSKPQYKTVTFVGMDGIVIEKQTVPVGVSAIAPRVPKVSGKKFTNWDVDFSNITDDLTVTALYREIDPDMVTMYSSITTGKIAKTYRTPVGGYTGTDPDWKTGTDLTEKTVQYLTDGDYGTDWETDGNQVWSPTGNSNSFAVIKLGDEPVSAEAFRIAFPTVRDYSSPNSVNPRHFRIYGTNDDAVENIDWREQFLDSRYKLLYDSETSNIPMHGSDYIDVPIWPLPNGVTYSEEERWGCYSDVNAIYTAGGDFGTGIEFENGFNYKYVILQIVRESHYTYISEFELLNEVDSYMVTFKDYDGRLIKKEQVIANKGAIAPVPTRDGYTFVGWDKDFSKINNNLIVTAQYTQNRYFVKAKAEAGGSVLVETESGKLEDVLYEESVKLVAKPDKHKKFDGWYDATTDKRVGSLENFEFKLTDNVDYIAKFKDREYTVIYRDEDGNLLMAVSGFNGDELTSPEAPHKDGYKFVGWSEKLTTFTNDYIVTPVYEKIENQMQGEVSDNQNAENSNNEESSQENNNTSQQTTKRRVKKVIVSYWPTYYYVLLIGGIVLSCAAVAVAIVVIVNKKKAKKVQ